MAMGKKKVGVMRVLPQIEVCATLKVTDKVFVGIKQSQKKSYLAGYKLHFYDANKHGINGKW